MGATFHEESHMSKASLGSSREVAQGCGVSFVNCLYLVPLIIGQNFCATSNQTGPESLTHLTHPEARGLHPHGVG